VKTIKDQISDLENTRGAKAARMADIMQKAIDDGRSTDVAEAEEFDTLKSEVETVDRDLTRLRSLEGMNLQRATPAAGGTAGEATASRGGVNIGSGVVTVKSNAPKGSAFTRYAMALAASKGNRGEAMEYAKRWADSTPEVATVLRAAVDAGTTTDVTWAKPLVEYQTMASEFIELLRPQTIVGRIPNLRRVPFNTRMPAQTGGSTVGWVGEGAAKPVSELAFSDVTLRWAKVAGIVVLTEELVRNSTPSAEAIVSSDLRASIAQYLDVQFTDPAVSEVSNVSPASITNGASTSAASGATADALRADIKTAFNAFLAANLTPTNGVWIMRPGLALSISLMTNALGQPEFAGINMNGGTLGGLPVVTSESVPAGLVILANASEILLADDGDIMLDVSREASLQMNSTPDNPATATTVMVSLWQNNLVGLRAERYITWKRRRAASVYYLTGAAYA
jgi:HK97 family phage major capsid protein